MDIFGIQSQCRFVILCAFLKASRLITEQTGVPRQQSQITLIALGTSAIKALLQSRNRVIDPSCTG